MHDPFRFADFIRAGYNHLTERFYLEIEHARGNIRLDCGRTAPIIVGLLEANGIRHFDYNADLASSAGRYAEFQLAAQAIGFEV